LEKESLQKLKMELEAEKRKVEEQLEAERALGVEKDRLLERSKKQESDLADDVVALQVDLETVDGQLDRAMQLQKETEEKHRATQLKYDEAVAHLRNLESAEASWREREQELLSSVQRSESEVATLLSTRDGLGKLREELQQKLREKEEDIVRVRERMEQIVTELEDKLSVETSAR
jgi:myosin heavy chain 9/10/11/14